MGRKQTRPALRQWLIENDFPVLLREMREARATWSEIANTLGVHPIVIQRWANILELRKPHEVPRTKFTEEDEQYISDAWAVYTPTEVIAERLGRDAGTIRQKILKLQRAGRISGRAPQGSRIYKLYGAELAKQAKDPKEVLRRLHEAKSAALAASLNAAKAAKQKRYEDAVELMLKTIEGGGDRNVAIFHCRAAGVTLERIAKEFVITRERVRKICANVAANMAVASFLSDKK